MTLLQALTFTLEGTTIGAETTPILDSGNADYILWYGAGGSGKGVFLQVRHNSLGTPFDAGAEVGILRNSDTNQIGYMRLPPKKFGIINNSTGSITFHIEFHTRMRTNVGKRAPS